MESIANWFNTLDLNLDINFDFDIYTIGKTALVLLLGTILLSVFGRFVFGKRSILNSAVSSAIGIVFIYTISILLRSAGVQYQNFIIPLPFIRISGNSAYLFSFQGSHYTAICGQLLSMIILSFLVNLADGWIPKGKSVFTWLFFRCLTVLIGYIMHLIVVGLFSTYLPDGIVTYAPVVLLALLILLLLTGALKILVGAFLTTVNPIIGGLYTFFFASIIGKQITKAILTTAILSAFIIALQYFGIAIISITASALLAYVPILLCLVILWYIVYKVF